MRLQAYLDQVQEQLGELPSEQLYLNLEVDVGIQKRLEKHHDLENYLTPLVKHLGRQRFVLATATKYVGGGSRLTVGTAVPAEAPTGFSCLEFECRCSADDVKKQVREKLLGQSLLAPGPVEVWHAWCCPPEQNWVALWKPTGDGMGPVLGEPYPQRPYYPNDDRIVSIAMHLNVDSQLERATRLVGVYWRHVSLTDLEPVQLTFVAPEARVQRTETPVRKRKLGRLLDYIVEAARVAGADARPIRLREWFDVFRDRFPDLETGKSDGSFSAAVGFQTINMRSRIEPQAAEEKQPWLREPLFKRVQRGEYMLLSGEEVRCFREAWAHGDPLVRADEYDVAELVRRYGVAEG